MKVCYNAIHTGSDCFNTATQEFKHQSVLDIYLANEAEGACRACSHSGHFAQSDLATD